MWPGYIPAHGASAQACFLSCFEREKKNAEHRKPEIVCLEMDEDRESGKRKEQSSRCHLFTGLVSLVTWLGRISAVVTKGGGHRISPLVLMMVN